MSDGMYPYMILLTLPFPFCVFHFVCCYFNTNTLMALRSPKAVF